MAANHVTVFISLDAKEEMEDLNDLREGAVDSVDWLGSINGEEVTVRLRLADEED